MGKYLNRGSKSTATLDELHELFDQAHTIALELEVISKNLSCAEIPAEVRKALFALRGGASGWVEWCMAQWTALDVAEVRDEIIAAGVDPDDDDAVDAWLARPTAQPNGAA